MSAAAADLRIVEASGEKSPGAFFVGIKVGSPLSSRPVGKIILVTRENLQFPENHDTD
jgi:hypothetical protein